MHVFDAAVENLVNREQNLTALTSTVGFEQKDKSICGILHKIEHIRLPGTHAVYIFQCCAFEMQPDLS